ncbi:hypothetical protein [Spirobacillus cienkowskii]|uniref:hypothetical protein n=1 Tax=Spirobacillus cienkowskii TaxID=495820 RepID=UPI0030CE9BFE
MKKIVLRSLAASTLALSGAAVAQDMDKKITTGGNFQLNMNTSNSTASDKPDFAIDKARVKTKVAGGIASGELEVAFKDSNAFDIRRAQLNLDALTLKSGDNTFTTTLSMGGIRIGGADLTAADITWAPQGYGRQDGAYLKETLALGKMANIELGAGLFNNITTYFVDSAVKGINDADNITKGKGKSLGLAAHVAATVNVDDNQSIGGKFYYGSQEKAYTDAGKTKARDVSHMEASVVYNHASIFGNKGVLSTNGVSFWYEVDDAKGGMSAAATSATDTNIVYGTANNDTLKSTLMGFGIAGDTGAYLTGMLQKGDRLTYAASYAMNKLTDGDTTTTDLNYDKKQMAFSVGYAVSSFELAFNFEHVKNNKAIFSDKGKSADADKKDTMMRSYLTMAYQF